MAAKLIYVGTTGPFMYDDSDETADSAARIGDTTFNAEQPHIPDIKANFVAGELDTEGKVITAINNIGSKINSILSALESAGILASS